MAQWEEELDQLSRRVFDIPLSLDRLNGSTTLRVGAFNGEIPLINRPTPEYAAAVNGFPPLEGQGDGVRSFIGLALHLMTSSQPIILIDEPEAFLHQAQAKALGRWLAKESVSRNRQVIVATHDRNMVLGLLDAETPVTVLRLSRSGDEAHLSQLASERLSEVWADPVFRYSNVLDGLFYSAVCVCEADADCRFYSAVLDGLEDGGEAPIKPDDVLFVPSGGKQRAPKLASALKDLKVLTFFDC
jgi:hypothetical protein